MISAALAAMNQDQGSPVRVLDPDNIDLSGNVSGDFVVAPAPF